MMVSVRLPAVAQPSQSLGQRGRLSQSRRRRRARQIRRRVEAERARDPDSADRAAASRGEVRLTAIPTMARLWRAATRSMAPMSAGCP
jgi:hypothetical protein